MAASKTIGGINVTISATIDKFQKSLTTARRLLNSFTKSIRDTIFSLKGLTAALALGGMTKLTVSAFQQIDALGELSDKTGIATETLGAYQLAAAEAGVSNEQLERSLTILAEKGMSLRGWVAQTAQLSTHQERLNATIEMFGIRGANMVRMVSGGTGALDDAQKAAESLGLAMDRKTVMGVERAIDAFGRFKLAVSGIFRSLAAEIAPFVEMLSNMAVDFLASNGNGAGIGKGIADAIIEMTKFVADTIAEMAASVIDMAQTVLGFFHDFRGSKVGEAMGMGFANDRERLDAMLAEGRLSNTARAIRANMPSAKIDQLIEDARKKAAEEAAKTPAARGSMFDRARGALGGLLNNPNVQNIRDLGGRGLLGLGRGINSLPGLLFRGQLAGAQFMAQQNLNRPGGAMGQRPALAFAESGSVDSYRQQAAIRRQSESIQKRQLEKQTEMARGIASIDKKTLPMGPLGLA